MIIAPIPSSSQSRCMQINADKCRFSSRFICICFFTLPRRSLLQDPMDILRGAISTVDRPLLGLAGLFFLHNVSHDHTRILSLTSPCDSRWYSVRSHTTFSPQYHSVGDSSNKLMARDINQSTLYSQILEPPLSCMTNTRNWLTAGMSSNYQLEFLIKNNHRQWNIDPFKDTVRPQAPLQCWRARSRSLHHQAILDG